MSTAGPPTGFAGLCLCTVRVFFFQRVCFQPTCIYPDLIHIHHLFTLKLSLSFSRPMKRSIFRQEAAHFRLVHSSAPILASLLTHRADNRASLYREIIVLARTFYRRILGEPACTQCVAGQPDRFESRRSGPCPESEQHNRILRVQKS